MDKNMEDKEIKDFMLFWIKSIKNLQNSINQGIIREQDLEAIEDYKDQLKLQSNNKVFNKFNTLFFKLDKIIAKNYYFDPTYNKHYRMLLPEKRKFKRVAWDKTRNIHINLIINLNKELDKINEKIKGSSNDFSKLIPKYNNKKQSILCGKIEVVLERDSAENSFCKILFEEIKTDESLSWDEIWEKMGENIDDARGKEKKKIYDLNRNLNQKIKNKLNNKEFILSKWENGYIVRKF